MRHSSSSVTDEDVPLQQRIRLRNKAKKKHNKVEDKNKKSATVLLQTKKFVIPRKKKTRELFETQALDTRDAKELLRIVTRSFYQPNISSTYSYEKVLSIQNKRIDEEFSAKKQEMRQEGYTQKEVEDSYAYSFCDSWDQVKKVAKEGLCTDSSCLTNLGDPKNGVYLSRYVDLVSHQPVSNEKKRYLMVFKIVKGKLKAVGERTGGDVCALEPTPNYDGHISKSFPPGNKIALLQAYLSSQFYFYEFAEDGDELYVPRPRQCCPHAVIQFSVTSTPFQSRDLTPRNSIINNDASPTVLELMSIKHVPDGKMYSKYSQAGRSLWVGVVKNKKNILSKAELICYSNDNLPFQIDEFIDIKAKVAYEKLQPLLPSPIFTQLPIISGKSKAFDNNAMYVYCEIRPMAENKEKLTKLISYFQEKNLAGVAEFPGSDAHIYVIPTSSFSHHLGITDEYYPDMLHALLLKKTPKEETQYNTNSLARMSTDPLAEAAVIRDIRKELHMQLEKTVIADNSMDVKDEVITNHDNNNNISIKCTPKHSGSNSTDFDVQSSTPVIVIDDDNFKSPPRVQTLSTVSDVALLPSPGHVTRHFHDPRLDVRPPVTNSFISPISAVATDSSARISTSKTVESCATSVSTYVTSSTVSQSETSNGKKLKVRENTSFKTSRLSSRLNALFSKQFPINTLSNDSTLVTSPQNLRPFSSEISTTASSTCAVSTATSSTSAVSATASSTFAVSATASSTSAVSATDNSTRAVPATDNSTRALPATDNSTRSVPATDNSTRALPATVNSTRSVPATDNSTRAVPATDNSTRALSATDTPTSAVSATDNSTRAVSATDNSTRALSATDNSTRALSATDNSILAVSATDTPTSAVSATDNSTSALSAADNSTQAVSATDNSTRALSATDNSTRALSATDTPTSAASATDNSTRAASATENSTQAAKDNSTRTLSAKDTSTSAVSATDNSTKAVSATNNSTRTISAKENSTKAVSVTDNTTRAVSAKDNSTRAVSAKEHSTRAVSAKEHSTRAVSAMSNSTRAVSAMSNSTWAVATTENLTSAVSTTASPASVVLITANSTAAVSTTGSATPAVSNTDSSTTDRLTMSTASSKAMSTSFVPWSSPSQPSSTSQVMSRNDMPGHTSHSPTANMEQPGSTTFRKNILPAQPYEETSQFRTNVIEGQRKAKFGSSYGTPLCTSYQSVSSLEQPTEELKLLNKVPDKTIVKDQEETEHTTTSNAAPWTNSFLTTFQRVSSPEGQIEGLTSRDQITALPVSSVVTDVKKPDNTPLSNRTLCVSSLSNKCQPDSSSQRQNDSLISLQQSPNLSLSSVLKTLMKHDYTSECKASFTSNVTTNYQPVSPSARATRGFTSSPTMQLPSTVTPVSTTVSVMTISPCTSISDTKSTQTLIEQSVTLESHATLQKLNNTSTINNSCGISSTIDTRRDSIERNQISPKSHHILQPLPITPTVTPSVPVSRSTTTSDVNAADVSARLPWTPPVTVSSQEHRHINDSTTAIRFMPTPSASQSSEVHTKPFTQPTSTISSPLRESPKQVNTVEKYTMLDGSSLPKMSRVSSEKSFGYGYTKRYPDVLHVSSPRSDTKTTHDTRLPGTNVEEKALLKDTGKQGQYDLNSDDDDSEEYRDEILDCTYVPVSAAPVTYKTSNTEPYYSPISPAGSRDDHVVSHDGSGDFDGVSLSGLSTVSEYLNSENDDRITSKDKDEENINDAKSRRSRRSSEKESSKEGSRIRKRSDEDFRSPKSKSSITSASERSHNSSPGRKERRTSRTTESRSRDPGRSSRESRRRERKPSEHRHHSRSDSGRRSDQYNTKHSSRHRHRRSPDRSDSKSSDRGSSKRKRHRKVSSSSRRRKIRSRSDSSSDGDNERRRHRTSNTSKRTQDKLDFSDQTILLEFAKPDVIERLEHLLKEKLQQTMEEVSNYQEDKPRPFFGGIGDVIYGRVSEPETIVVQDPKCRTVQVKRAMKRPAIDIDGEDGRWSNECKNIFPNCGFNRDAVAPNDHVKCKDQDGVKEFFENNAGDTRNGEKCLQTEDTISPKSRQCGEDEKNAGSGFSFSTKYVAEFKEKRRRRLVQKLRRERAKEKVTSTQVTLAKIKRIKSEVNELNKIMNVAKSVNRDEESKVAIKDSPDALDEANKRAKYDLTPGNVGARTENVGYVSDHNVVSMEISDSEMEKQNVSKVNNCVTSKADISKGMHSNIGPASKSSIEAMHSVGHPMTSTSVGNKMIPKIDDVLQRSDSKNKTQHNSNDTSRTPEIKSKDGCHLKAKEVGKYCTPPKIDRVVGYRVVLKQGTALESRFSELDRELVNGDRRSNHSEISKHSVKITSDNRICVTFKNDSKMNSKKTSSDKSSTAEKPTQSCSEGNSKSNLKNIPKNNSWGRKVTLDNKDHKLKTNPPAWIDKNHTDLRSKIDKTHSSQNSVLSQDSRKSSGNKRDDLGHKKSILRNSSSEFDEVAAEARRRFQFGIDIMARKIWCKYNLPSLGHTSPFSHKASTSKLSKTSGNVEEKVCVDKNGMKSAEIDASTQAAALSPCQSVRHNPLPQHVPEIHTPPSAGQSGNTPCEEEYLLDDKKLTSEISLVLKSLPKPQLDILISGSPQLGPRPTKHPPSS